MTRRQIARGILFATPLITMSPVTGWAEDQPAPAAPPPPNTGAFSFTFNLTFPTAYYFRGIAQSNAGFQFEPYAELKATLYTGEDTDPLKSAYVKVAGFSHFQAVAPYTVMTEEEFMFRKKKRDPFILSVLQGSRVMLYGDEESMLA